MKARTATLALLAGLMPAAVGAQQFEGTVTYRMSMGGMSMEMTQYVKEGKIRQEMSSPMGQMVTIYDREAGKVAIQAPGQPMQVMELEAMQAMAEQASEGGQAEVTAQGTTETIAGHSCDNYLIKQGATEATTCVARGLGFVTGTLEGPNNAFDWERLQDEFKDGFFPLKITTATPQGQMVLEAVSLERKALSADLFKIGG